MENKSKLIRGTSKCARFFVCDSTELVKEAKRIHGTDPVNSDCNDGKGFKGGK